MSKNKEIIIKGKQKKISLKEKNKSKEKEEIDVESLLSLDSDELSTMDPYCCNLNSSFAYICDLKNNNNERKVISIVDYIKNTDLQEEIKNRNKILVCEKGEELIKYESIKRRSHFKHKNNAYNEMSEWHTEWQENFDNNEVYIGNRYADAVCNNNVLEFQYSYISKKIVNLRTKNYLDKGYNIHWIIDGNNAVTFEKNNDSVLLTIKNEWKYKSFVDLPFIYINIANMLYLIHPREVKSCMIETKECIEKQTFIENIKNNVGLNTNELNISKSIIYYNQRGAGCGKTYESIQLVQKDDRFVHKNIFIYLTKMHSAKDVIRKELEDQRKRGDLNNLKFEEGETKKSKQYKFEFTDIKTNINKKIIIGTIDSFMYSINKENKVGDKDFFVGIVRSIRDGFINLNKYGTISYAGENSHLNKKCLIIIDEAQDLCSNYIEAFDMIVQKTGIDVYVIGDKLQSLWDDLNVLTYLENNKLYTVVKTNKGINYVMRFHHKELKNFVNKIVDFGKYGLPEIEKVCDKPNCRYKHEDEECTEDNKPWKIFDIPQFYDRNEGRIERTVTKIINFLNLEVENYKYQYTPENFLFIFPTITKNELAYILESKLQEYWINKFQDPNYINNVLKQKEYWKDNMDTNKFYKYAHIHKSDDGKSINLRESEYATRMVSIHSSKGDGREVVFLLGISEESLKLFSKDKCNLIYDSLVHVALTRQKKKIYIGLPANNHDDDIRIRFEKNKYAIELNSDIEPNLMDIKNKINLEKITNYIKNNTEIFKNINDIIIKPNKELGKLLEDLENKDVENNNIIDFGHHIIRYCVFYHQIMYYLCGKNIDKKVDVVDCSQYITILKAIAKLNIEQMNCNQYYKFIKNIYSGKRCINGEWTENTEFPIMILNGREYSKYMKYANTIKNFILQIQKKIIKCKRNKLPNLCPLESVILHHMILLNQKGIKTDISIMEIYYIIYCYDESSHLIKDSHQEYGCICHEEFKGNGNYKNNEAYEDIRISIIKHYDILKNMNKIFKNYEDNLNKLFHNQKFKYNTIHHVSFFKESENFKIKYQYPIIAYSEEYVIHFMIKPQMSKLNFNDIMCEIIGHNYVLKNAISGTNNHERYNGKKIYACIFTFDSLNPIILNMNIDKDNVFIKYSIKKYLEENYRNKHYKVHDYYIYHKKIKDSRGEKKNSIDYICQKLESSENKDVPKYIKNYFDEIKKELIKLIKSKKVDRKDEILKSVTDRITFLENLGEELKLAIDDYLNLNEEDTDF